MTTIGYFGLLIDLIFVQASSKGHSPKNAFFAICVVACGTLYFAIWTVFYYISVINSDLYWNWYDNSLAYLVTAIIADCSWFALHWLFNTRYIAAGFSFPILVEYGHLYSDYLDKHFDPHTDQIVVSEAQLEEIKQTETFLKEWKSKQDRSKIIWHYAFVLF